MVEPGISIQYGSGSSFSWGTVLTVAATVFTAAISALAALGGSWISNRHQEKLQDARIKADNSVRELTALRLHGEEIGTLLYEWAESYQLALNNLKVALSARRLKDEHIAAVVANDKKLSRVIMLIKIDFPELNPILDELLKVRNNGYDALTKLENVDSRGMKAAFPIFDTAEKDFQPRYTALSRALIAAMDRRCVFSTADLQTAKLQNSA